MKNLVETTIERTASLRRKQAAAWSGDAEIICRGKPGSMPEETTLTPLRPGMIDALTLALALRPPRALILSRNSALG